MCAPPTCFPLVQGIGWSIFTSENVVAPIRRAGLNLIIFADVLVDGQVLEPFEDLGGADINNFIPTDLLIALLVAVCEGVQEGNVSSLQVRPAVAEALCAESVAAEKLRGSFVEVAHA
eukprot:CAMPEP_0206505728 /NCGR_PEP_ID=MMETSP0324_2-20121206/56317_1 /ASSEMBLY_ACC=CAM_ASM_000836 /TAXON_ID=2866 /ORGANISM="Crypthecodinium cohnii, Strain Seligo" /LENGTH=117 /DNA_ID=CAMNT_0053995271 /DNA_START=505 /DNA_END=854 /DNA_ORIENTATION=-